MTETVILSRPQGPLEAVLEDGKVIILKFPVTPGAEERMEEQHREERHDLERHLQELNAEELARRVCRGLLDECLQLHPEDMDLAVETAVAVTHWLARNIAA
jgi:hypothetical protein